MSHFSVMVITDRKPSHEDLQAILAPWHEFECTGLDNEFVLDIDQTADKRSEYESNTLSRLRGPDGTYHSPYDDRFYRDPTDGESKKIGPMAGTGGGHGMSWTSRDWDDGRGYRAKVKFVPDGFEEVEVAALHLMTFREWLTYETGRPEVHSGEPLHTADGHKYGYIQIGSDGEVLRVIDRTNPNAKWDWWTVGGRWSGMLAPSYDPHTDPENLETCFLCDGSGVRLDGRSGNGCNGCSGSGKKLKHAPKWRDVGNIAQVRDLRLAALRDAKGHEAGETYDRRHAIIAGRQIPDFDRLIAEHGTEKGRELWFADPIRKDLGAAGDDWLDQDDWKTLRSSRAEAVERGRQQALATFAVVKDGQWHERGSMGWFACVSDEQDGDTWRRDFNRMLDELPPEAWVAIVDCHI